MLHVQGTNFFYLKAKQTHYIYKILVFSSHTCLWQVYVNSTMDTNVKRTVTNPRILEYMAKLLTASIRYSCPVELSLWFAETYSTMVPVTSPKNHIIRGIQMPDTVAHMTAMMIPKTSSHVAYRYCKDFERGSCWRPVSTYQLDYRYAFLFLRSFLVDFSAGTSTAVFISKGSCNCNQVVWNWIFYKAHVQEFLKVSGFLNIHIIFLKLQNLVWKSVLAKVPEDFGKWIFVLTRPECHFLWFLWSRSGSPCTSSSSWSHAGTKRTAD